MDFKPTKWKSIISILAVIVWIILMRYYTNLAMCGICVPKRCGVDYANWMVVKPACYGCFCTSFSTMLKSNLFHILIPFAIVYVIWSLIEKPKQEGRKKK